MLVGLLAENLANGLLAENIAKGTRVGPILGEPKGNIRLCANFARDYGRRKDRFPSIFSPERSSPWWPPLLTATHLQGKIQALPRLDDTIALRVRKFEIHWTVIV